MRYYCRIDYLDPKYLKIVILTLLTLLLLMLLIFCFASMASAGQTVNIEKMQWTTRKGGIMISIIKLILCQNEGTKTEI
jgi:ABC-type proline/glycine betaine transport system substrate-binding protein